MVTALLVIDMQNFFASMVKTAQPNITSLISHFQKHSLPIIFTQHGHPPADFQPPWPNQLVRKWGCDGSLQPKTQDWQFVPAIQKHVDKLGARSCNDMNELPKAISNVGVERQQHAAATVAAAAVVLHKNTYDAFINTPLASLLYEKNVETVVCCGVMTDCCVDTTARSAFNRGWGDVGRQGRLRQC